MLSVRGKVLHLLSAPTTSHSHPTYRPRDSRTHTHSTCSLCSDSHTALSSTSWHLPHTHLRSFQADLHPGSMRLGYGEDDEDKLDSSQPFWLGSPWQLYTAFTVSHSNPPYHTNFPRMPLLYMHWSGAEEHRNTLHAHGSLQSADIGLFGFVCECLFVFISFFWPCSCHSSSASLFVCVTFLCWTLLRRQSWSASWTSWKTRIRTRFPPCAQIPSMTPMTIFIQTTLTPLVILMRTVCLPLQSEFIMMDIIENLVFRLWSHWWKCLFWG